MLLIHSRVVVGLVKVRYNLKELERTAATSATSWTQPEYIRCQVLFIVRLVSDRVHSDVTRTFERLVRHPSLWGRGRE